MNSDKPACICSNCAGSRPNRCDPIFVHTTDCRKVPAKCLLWSVKDRCCSRLRPVETTVPLLDTFEKLLDQLRPEIPDATLLGRSLADGDPLPDVQCPAAVNWLAIRVDGEPQVAAWAELDADGVKRLRLRMPPGMNECKATATVASVETGLVASFDLNLVTPFEYQSYDGSGNNLQNPTFGVADTPLRRVGTANYGDGRSTLRDGVNPRLISNAVARWPNAGEPPLSAANLSDMVWVWGQFLDHELDLTPEDSGETADVVAPADDPTLPNGTIAFHRSRFVVDERGVRQQINVISAFIDGTNLYGASSQRALALRTLDGSGKLKVSHGNLGPLNVGAVFDNANMGREDAQQLFLFGDVRGNENAALISIHTLFVREHNWWCDTLLAEHPEWRQDDERLFQEARRRVVAEMQHVTFAEFLPALLGNGSGALGPYTGYDASVDSTIATEFSTALYRVGHTMVSDKLHLGTDGQTVALADVFFKPSFIKSNGIDGVLEGAATHRMQQIDNFVVEALRNMLFGRPDDPAGRLHDLATLNLQRGRDHGLPLYNDAREAYGLARKASIDDITSNADVRAALNAAFGGNVDLIDLWTGALCEDHLDGNAQVGQLLATGLKEQFERLRHGDRFWYQSALPDDVRIVVESTTLADIVRRNTGAQVQPDVFRVPS